MKTVVVSVGTYHVPFDRLTEWIRPWAQRNPSVRLILQHGPGQPLLGAENHSTLPYLELLDLCSRADVIVLQGGAGGVMDTRQLGRMPIVVPRIPGGDEVVDDHQLLFTAEAANLGIIHRALSRDTLWDLLDDAIAGELQTQLSAALETPGVQGVSDLLATIPAITSRRTRLRRAGRSLRGLVAPRHRYASRESADER